MLRSLTNDDLVGPACLATLLHAANGSHISDSYSLAEQLESERVSASDEALLLLATVQWHCNELEAGLLTLDQLDESAATDVIQRSGKAVNAWILMAQAGIAKPHATGQHDDSDDDAQDAASNISEARSIFRVVLAADPSHIDVSLANQLLAFCMLLPVASRRHQSEFFALCSLHCEQLSVEDKKKHVVNIVF